MMLQKITLAANITPESLIIQLADAVITPATGSPPIGVYRRRKNNI